MKYCPSCGTQNPDDAKYCGKCGNAMPVSAPPPPPPHHSQSHNTGTGSGHPAVSDGLKIGIIVVSIVIPLVGIIMGIIYMNDPNPSKKSVGKSWLWVSIGASVFWCIIGMLAGIGGSGY